MTKQDLIMLLNGDLRNEYMHFHFYLHSAIMVQGIDRNDLREFFIEEAAGEMEHIKLFGDVIVGLGGIPSHLPNAHPSNLTNPKDILAHALTIEEEVINNYVTRIHQATQLEGADGKYVEIFLENQIADSRKDADNIRQMIKGNY